MSEQTFADFKSKYLDLYDKVKTNIEKEKVSILEDVDFEVELLRRDEINVDYILRLLSELVGADEEKKTRILSNIHNILASDAILRSKRELIEKFINQSIPNIDDADDVQDEFETFWTSEKAEAFEKMCIEEGLMTEKLQKLIDDYLFTGRKPLRNDLANALTVKPSALKRDSIITKVSNKLNRFIETFVDNI